jgi:hypothetical protein
LKISKIAKILVNFPSGRQRANVIRLFTAISYTFL